MCCRLLYVFACIINLQQCVACIILSRSHAATLHIIGFLGRLRVMLIHTSNKCSRCTSLRCIKRALSRYVLILPLSTRAWIISPLASNQLFKATSVENIRGTDPGSASARVLFNPSSMAELRSAGDVQVYRCFEYTVLSL